MRCCLLGRTRQLTLNQSETSDNLSDRFCGLIDSLKADFKPQGVSDWPYSSTSPNDDPSEIEPIISGELVHSPATAGELQ